MAAASPAFKVSSPTATSPATTCSQARRPLAQRMDWLRHPCRAWPTRFPHPAPGALHSRAARARRCGRSDCGSRPDRSSFARREGSRPVLGRHDPDLQQMAGFGGAGVELGMDDAAPGAHALDFAGADDAAAAGGILVLERAVHQVGDDLHVAVAMRRKAAAAPDPVLVDDPQGPEAFMRRVVIVAERKGMFGIEPADLGGAAVVRICEG